MMDVITGKTRPDPGSAWFGQTIDLLSLHEPEIAQAGIGRKFQKPTVFEQHHGVREPGTGTGGRPRRSWNTLRRDSPARSATASTGSCNIIGLSAQRDASLAGSCRTARSSGSRLACC